MLELETKIRLKMIEIIWETIIILEQQIPGAILRKETLTAPSVLQHFSDRGRHQGPWWNWVLLFKLITNLLHGHKFNSFMLLEVLNKSVTIRLVSKPPMKIIATHRSCIRRTCGLPETSGWIVIGKINSSYSR